jgi:hypothetical protein
MYKSGKIINKTEIKLNFFVLFSPPLSTFQTIKYIKEQNIYIKEQNIIKGHK